MYNRLEFCITRKVVATFVTTTIASITMSLSWIVDSWFELPYNRGDYFLSLTIIYMIYVGVITLTFGNVVSIGIEYIQSKWFFINNGLYMLLHGLFGLANGIWFQSWFLAIAGMAAAFLYAAIDRWLYIRLEENQAINWFIYIPILVFGLLWSSLQWLSAPLPPFTKEAAIERIVSEDGSATESIPRKSGKWSGTIEGFQIKRETTVKEIGKEKYIVTFIEEWESEMDEGIWERSYEVDRYSSTFLKEEGEKPPYRY